MDITHSRFIFVKIEHKNIAKIINCLFGGGAKPSSTESTFGYFFYVNFKIIIITLSILIENNIKPDAGNHPKEWIMKRHNQ